MAMRCGMVTGMRWFSRICGACLFVLGMLGVPGVEAAEGAGEWSRFRGPDGQGIARTSAVGTSWNQGRGVAWKTALPGPGASSAIHFADRVYVIAHSGHAVPGKEGGDINDLKRHVLCLRAADGALLWQRDVPAVQPEQARVREHGYAASTPVADADHVYVFLGKSGVLALTHDGSEVWRADVGSSVHEWGSAASPVLHKDRVIINAAVESGAVVALDRRTGRELWRRNGLKESWNTPILVPVEGGREELVVAMLGKVLGIDPDTGEELWSCATGIGWYMVPSLVNDGDIVYCIGGRTGGSLAVKAGGKGDVTASRRLWVLNKGSNVSSPILHRGHLYFLHENLGVLYCVEAASGRLVYEERIPGAGQFYASPVLAGDRLLCVARNGVLFVLAANPQFELIGRSDAPQRSIYDGSPSFAGGLLLIRSDHFLYAIKPDEP